MVDDKARRIILDYLKGCKLMSVSTLHEGSPRSFVCWFSFDEDFNFYFISSKDSVHVGDVEKYSRVSLSVVSPEVSSLGVSGDGKFQGLMIEGVCERVRGLGLAKGALNFLKKFPAASDYVKMVGGSKVELGKTKIYRIVAKKGVWFDQVNFEEEKVELEF